MPGLLLHVGALLTCPHGGTVAPQITAPPRVMVNGAQQVLSVADLLTVAGCPFQIPVPGGTKPQPCVTVRVEPAARVLVNGSPAALLSPAVLCYSVEQIPQGPPNSAPVQKRVLAT